MDKAGKEFLDMINRVKEKYRDHEPNQLKEIIEEAKNKHKQSIEEAKKYLRDILKAGGDK